MSWEGTALFSRENASVSSIVLEPMSAILPKCYQSQGQSFLLSSKSLKKSGNAQRKPQYGPKERSDQRTLGKLMGANATKYIQNAIGL